MDAVVLRARVLEHPRLRHGFSQSIERHGSAAGFYAQAGFDGARPVSLSQVHGREVVELAQVPDGPLEGDALVSGRPGLALTVRAADCVPILLADPDAELVAAVHSGWRGTRQRVVQHAVHELCSGGARAERLRAAIGPCVEQGCYEVGAEVAAALGAELPNSARHLDAELRLDLRGLNRELLLEAGLRPDHIELLAVCTRCDTRYASYRRDGQARSTNLAAIALVG